jgi:thiosulfate/3-mercaptopyruvate sulfurtransferase
MNAASPLIGAEELARTLAQWRVVDCSHDLEDLTLGARLFAQAHIPGAVHAHLDQALSGAKTGHNGRHPLPRAQDLCAWLGAQGIAPDAPVVAYDRSGGSYAARLWWLLRWLGHTGPVRVLDGGLAAWEAAGGLASSQATIPTPVAYPVPATHDALWVDLAFIEHNLATGEVLVVDARGAPRYLGEVEPIDPRPGHIPGAANRPFPQNLGADGRFKPASVLASEWEAVLGGRNPAQSVAQCGSGVTACHNLLAMEIAGLPGARLYPGSWSEWCSDPARPARLGRE